MARRHLALRAGQIAQEAAGQPPCVWRSAARGSDGALQVQTQQARHRLVYGVQDDVLIVVVMPVDKREDSVVYQSAMARVSEKMAELAKAVQKRLKS